jgi:hypothetical protein
LFVFLLTGFYGFSYWVSWFSFFVRLGYFGRCSQLAAGWPVFEAWEIPMEMGAPVCKPSVRLVRVKQRFQIVTKSIPRGGICVAFHIESPNLILNLQIQRAS